MNALVIEHLSYGKARKQILTDVNLTVGQGQVVGLLGANGAGKTTLMRLIAGGAVRHQGTITVADVAEPTKRRALVSYSDQLAGVMPGMTLRAITTMMARLYPDFDPARYQEMAQALGLKSSQRLKRLSKGNQRKFVLAVTLARTAVLYLLDEPFDGIDVMTRKAMLQGILQWLPETATLMISDHHVTDIEALLDQVIIIKDGTVATQIATDTIRQTGQSVEGYFADFYEEGEHDAAI